MTKIKRSMLVSFSAEQMYNLVNDVTQYPHFLPGCVDAKLLYESETEMVAGLEISKLGLTHFFVTRNQLTKNRQIEMILEEGPFKFLNGTWRFIEIDTYICQVEFNLTFEFTSHLIAFAFGPIFKELTYNMVQSFNQRAKIVYGSLE